MKTVTPIGLVNKIPIRMRKRAISAKRLIVLPDNDFVLRERPKPAKVIKQTITDKIRKNNTDIKCT